MNIYINAARRFAFAVTPILLLSCTGDQPVRHQTSSETVLVTPVEAPVSWPKITSAVQRDEELEQRVAALLTQMSLQEKVGQMLQPEVKFITPAEVKEFHIGAVLNGGGSIAGADQYATLEEWVARADTYYEASVDVSDGKIGVPIIWGTDSMHGASNIIGATIFPHNIGLGATRNPDLMYQIGRATAIETLTAGLDWLFAPTVAVVRDDRWGRTYEAFSEEPNIVAGYAPKIVEGIQGAVEDGTLFRDGYLLANVKHFIGDGGTESGDDQGNTLVSEQVLKNIHGPGYFTALAAGAQVVMASFNSWNGDKVHGQKYLLTNVLKEQMGFDGFLVSDWNAHGQVEGCTNTSCPQAINAGIDMVMVPSDWKGLYFNTIKSVESGEISIDRINDAVTRILRVKARMGLFESLKPSQRRYSAKHEYLGSDVHRMVARQAVRESLVLLKNKNNILPLSPSSNVLVVGAAADDIGKASGGWTVTWQGVTQSNQHFPGGTSIYQGIKNVVEAAGGNVELSLDGSVGELAQEIPDLAIVVYGENPYAEMQGDLHTLEYQAGVHSDLHILKGLKARGIPVVSVFISGRPMWVNQELNASDAFVAAWLPGSEGGGVADVIFSQVDGSIRDDFKGKLSFSWPKYVNQNTLNIGDEEYDPLFPYGYGLNYTQVDTLPDNLTENAVQNSDGDSVHPIELFVGRPISPWELKISNTNKVESIRSLLPREITHIRSSTEDKNIQGDSRRIAWLGTGSASMGLYSDTQVDLSRVASIGMALTMDIKMVSKPSGSVFATLECGVGCMSSLNVQNSLSTLSTGLWQDYSIPLHCFKAEELNLNKITSVLSFSSSDQMEFVVANIYLSPLKQSDEKFDCSSL